MLTKDKPTGEGFGGSTRCGFSLVELTVVIAIIGILVAIGSVKYDQYKKRLIKADMLRLLKNFSTFVQSDANYGSHSVGHLYVSHCPTLRQTNTIGKIVVEGLPMEVDTVPADFFTNREGWKHHVQYAVQGNGADYIFAASWQDGFYGATAIMDAKGTRIEEYDNLDDPANGEPFDYCD